MTQVELWFAILALVLLASALASGVIDRIPLSLPIIFLGLGLLLGAGALDVIKIDSHNPALLAIATLNLALVLFLDAARLDVSELRQEWRVPLLDLGPGTILTIVGIAFASSLLLHTSLIQSILLGAVLSSTDPIVLRDVVRNEQVPRSVRRTLTIEAGTNDIIVLPIVLIMIQLLLAPGGGFGYWLGFLARLLVLSPLVGLAVGGVGAWLMGKADARYSIRREYQALYGIGLVLASYSVAQAVGGDGFLAAYFAGLAVAIFDITLCDCFLEYGEVTAEMAMLLAFILFGVVLGPLFGTIPFFVALVLAILAIIVVRPLAIGLAFMRAMMSREARVFIAWFGPRGLSSLLLALLIVEANTPYSTQLLAVTGVAVLVSVLVHGVTATPASQWYGKRVAQEIVVRPEERESTPEGLFRRDAAEIPRITSAKLHEMLTGPRPPVVLDVRTRGQYSASDGQIPGSIRVLPDQVREWVQTTTPLQNRPIIAYCT